MQCVKNQRFSVDYAAERGLEHVLLLLIKRHYDKECVPLVERHLSLT